MYLTGYYTPKYLTVQIKKCSFSTLIAGKIYHKYNEIHWAIHFNRCYTLLGKDFPSKDDTKKIEALGLQCFQEFPELTFGHLAQISRCLGRFKVTNSVLWSHITSEGLEFITPSVCPIEFYMFIKGLEESPSHQYLNHLHLIEDRFTPSDILKFRPNLLVSWVWIYLDLGQKLTTDFISHILTTIWSNLETYSDAELCIILKTMVKMPILEMGRIDQIEILLIKSCMAKPIKSSIYGAIAKHFIAMQHFPKALYQCMKLQHVTMLKADQTLWNTLISAQH